MNSELQKQIVTDAALEELAAQGNKLSPTWLANTHVHLPPNFSAFQSVEQAVELAGAANVRVLGASNYYDFSVYHDMETQARRCGVYPLFGLEVITTLANLREKGILINDPGNPGRVYVCGKGISRFDPMTEQAQCLMSQIRRNDSDRAARIIARLEEVFTGRGVKTGLSEEAITEKIIGRYGVRRDQICLQERHIAQAFQGALFDLVPPPERIQRLSRILESPTKALPDDAVRVQGEIRSHLMKVGKPAFVAEQFLSFDQGIRLILELDGIPSYPTLADGASPICSYEDPPEKLIEVLKQQGIHCAEFIPIRNEPPVLERYVRAMRNAGMVITGGTEHNTPELLPLEPRCVRGQPVPESLRGIFQEGACVVAAHQFLARQGRCGFVDRDGALNPHFPDGESRISYFHGLGAGLIARYHEQSFA